jgi:hypothetical protein
MSPKVEISDCSFEDSAYQRDDSQRNARVWNASTLVKAAKDQKCKVFDLPLAGINLRILPFQIKDLDDFVYQVKRMNDTDLKYPIILDWCGQIADGWHRVAKAIYEGKATIKAYRLKKYVKPDKIEKETN